MMALPELFGPGPQNRDRRIAVHSHCRQSVASLAYGFVEVFSPLVAGI